MFKWFLSSSNTTAQQKDFPTLESFESSEVDSLSTFWPQSNPIKTCFCSDWRICLFKDNSLFPHLASISSVVIGAEFPLKNSPKTSFW